MASVPYSRYIVFPVTWYSFLIMTGIIAAVFLASREARKSNLPDDTVIDLSLWIIPFGIIGARLYYVIFSWNHFSNNLLSILKVWEGGLAIYGGVIAGMVVLFIFSRKRRIPLLKLCDIVVPGLVLAQSIGRWGNWFNMEAYGLTVHSETFCFFPFAVQIPADHYSWHLATFFYESLWDFCIFIFLLLSRRRMLTETGDVFFVYLFLYSAGRLFIEELRLDSLYASSIRISQLLSVIICIMIFIRYTVSAQKNRSLSSAIHFPLFLFSSLYTLSVLLYTLCHSLFAEIRHFTIILVLLFYSILIILHFFFIFLCGRKNNADNPV